MQQALLKHLIRPKFWVNFGSGGADGGVEGAAISLKPLPTRALRGVVSLLLYAQARLQDKKHTKSHNSGAFQGKCECSTFDTMFLEQSTWPDAGSVKWLLASTQ
jgi:hypothetical protein